MVPRKLFWFIVGAEIGILIDAVAYVATYGWIILYGLFLLIPIIIGGMFGMYSAAAGKTISTWAFIISLLCIPVCIYAPSYAVNHIYEFVKNGLLQKVPLYPGAQQYFYKVKRGSGDEASIAEIRMRISNSAGIESIRQFYIQHGYHDDALTSEASYKSYGSWRMSDGSNHVSLNCRVTVNGWKDWDKEHPRLTSGAARLYEPCEKYSDATIEITIDV